MQWCQFSIGERNVCLTYSKTHKVQYVEIDKFSKYKELFFIFFVPNRSFAKPWVYRHLVHLFSKKNCTKLLTWVWASVCANGVHFCFITFRAFIISQVFFLVHVTDCTLLNQWYYAYKFLSTCAASFTALCGVVGKYIMYMYTMLDNSKDSIPT